MVWKASKSSKKAERSLPLKANSAMEKLSSSRVLRSRSASDANSRSIFADKPSMVFSLLPISWFKFSITKARALMESLAESILAFKMAMSRSKETLSRCLFCRICCWASISFCNSANWPSNSARRLVTILEISWAKAIPTKRKKPKIKRIKGWTLRFNLEVGVFEFCFKNLIFLLFPCPP